jgi:hypothetical protein
MLMLMLMFCFQSRAITEHHFNFKLSMMAIINCHYPTSRFDFIIRSLLWSWSLSHFAVHISHFEFRISNFEFRWTFSIINSLCFSSSLLLFFSFRFPIFKYSNIQTSKCSSRGLSIFTQYFAKPSWILLNFKSNNQTVNLQDSQWFRLINDVS